MIPLICVRSDFAAAERADLVEESARFVIERMFECHHARMVGMPRCGVQSAGEICQTFVPSMAICTASIGGFVGPKIIGEMSQRTGSFREGFIFMIACWTIASLLVLVCPRLQS